MQVEDATRRCVALHPGPSRCASLTGTPHPVNYHTRLVHTKQQHTSASPLRTVGLATLAQYPGYSPDALAGVSLVGTSIPHRQEVLSSP